jgi:hypothetical protein
MISSRVILGGGAFAGLPIVGRGDRPNKKRAEWPRSKVILVRFDLPFSVIPVYGSWWWDLERGNDRMG